MATCLHGELRVMRFGLDSPRDQLSAASVPWGGVESRGEEDQEGYREREEKDEEAAVTIVVK